MVLPSTKTRVRDDQRQLCFTSVDTLRLSEFVPSGAIAAGQAQARAKKYKSRKGQEEERKVRQEEIDDNKVVDPLEKRAVFA